MQLVEAFFGLLEMFISAPWLTLALLAGLTVYMLAFSG